MAEINEALKQSHTIKLGQRSLNIKRFGYLHYVQCNWQTCNSPSVACRGEISGGLIPTPKSRESILLCNFLAKDLILDHESILFISDEWIL